MADKRGCNSVDYIGKRKGKDAYVLGFIDENDEAVPTGLPTIYLFDGNAIEIVAGMEGLEKSHFCALFDRINLNSG